MGTAYQSKHLYELLKPEHQCRTIFQWMELGLFMEIVHHMLGWAALNRRHLVNILIYNFVLFGVIAFFPLPQHNLVLWWMLVRTLSTVVRNSYHIYVNMDLKFVYPAFDWFRMTTFYVLYTAEYVISVLLVLAVFPYIKRSSQFHIHLPNQNKLQFDFAWIYLLYLTASLPNFIASFVHLHMKRAQQLA